MEERDLYTILGVPRNAAQAAIRSAFRALALRHHPDRAGPSSAERFAEIRAAYETLSDAAARRAYDDARSRRAERTAPPRGPHGRGRPSALDARFADRVRPVDWIGTRPPQVVLRCEVVLPLEEAARGALIPIRLPVPPAGWVVLRLAIPAGVRDGLVLEFPVGTVGGASSVLRAYVRIA